MADTRAESAPGHDVDGDVQEGFEVQQETTEVEQSSPGIDVDEEIEIAVFVVVPARYGAARNGGARRAESGFFARVVRKSSSHVPAGCVVTGGTGRQLSDQV